MADGNTYISGVNNQGNPFSYEQQFLMQLMVLARLHSVEFKPGMDDRVVFTFSNGVTENKPVHIEDNREIFCNAVQHLFDYIHFNLVDFVPRKTEEDYAKGILEQYKAINEYKPDGKDVETYKNELVEMHRELFRRIMRFSKSMNFYQGRTTASSLRG